MTDDVTPEPPVPTGEPPAPPAPAPEVEPGWHIAVAPTTRVAKRSGRTALLVTLAVLVVAGLGAAALVVARSGERDAGEALDAARSAVEDAGSFRFTLRTTDLLVEGDSDNSTETTTRTTEDGEWADGTWHVTSTDEYSAYETIVAADGTTYERWSDGGDGIRPDDRWDRYEMPAGPGEPVDMVESIADMADMADFAGPVPGDEDMGEAYADETAVGVAVMLYLSGEGAFPTGDPTGALFGPGFGAGGDPTGFLDALQEYGEPRLDGPDTVTATLQAPAELSDALGRPIPDGEVSLVLGADDRPATLSLRVAGEHSSSDVELSFADWDADIAIEIPGDDAIDPTPWVEEEDIEALDLVPVLPTDVPEGWETYASVIPATEWDGEGPEDCDVLDVSYDQALPPEVLDDPDAFLDADFEDLGYIWTYQSSLDCALALDDAPFEPGGPAGLPHRTSDYGAEQVLVGDTVVEIESSLTGPELEAVIASLAPTDIATLIALASEPPADWPL